MKMQDVEVRDNLWIPVSATIRLSARLWLPAAVVSVSSTESLPDAPSATASKCSVVLEYLPYRKGDWTAPRDARNHIWMAQRGIAVARVDVRGSGNSLGYNTGEYTREELDDGVAVIAWLASQPWCTGSVGVFGKSWGGFNGLQLAAMAPPALKGVVSLYSIDDRYADDVHYMGGAVMGSEALSWATVMLAWNARPPAPETVGDAAAWHAAWRDRLEHHTPWLYDWLSHQPRDAFWQHGSICESYAAVQCPVLLIGGWADGYYNGVQRMVTSVPNCNGVIGPWSHDWPHVATPGPPIGFLDLCFAWWERTLNGKDDTRAAAMPDLQLFVKDAMTKQDVSPQIGLYPGTWRSVEDASTIQQHFVTLSCRSHGTLVRLDASNEALDTTVPNSNDEHVAVPTRSLQGAWSGEWLSFGGPDMPGDQTTEDALATTWTTAPLALDDGIEIVGYPEVRLAVQSSHPQALIAARLCDVSPTGTSTLIARGVLNLSHRNGHAPADLQHMPVGETVAITLRLNYCAYRIAPGHRVRLALTPQYWPLLWPSPTPVELTIMLHHDNVVRLPVLEGNSSSSKTNASCPVETFPLDRGTPSRAITLREPAALQRTLSLVLSEVDPSKQQQQELRVVEDDGTSLLVDEGITMDERCEKRYRIDPSGRHPRVDITRSLTYEKLDASTLTQLLNEHADAVAVATGRTRHEEEVKVTRVDFAEHDALPWRVQITTTSAMWSDATTFYLEDHLLVLLDSDVFYETSWTKDIARTFV